MIVKVDHKFRLRTDRSGWTIQQKRPLLKGPRAGEVEWADEGHFDTLQWACVGLYRLMLHEGAGEVQLAQVAKRVDEVERRIMDAVAIIQPRIPDVAEALQTKAPVVPLSPWDRVGA